MKKPRRYKSCFEQVLSENPFGLEFLVFGNANMDDRIDENDLKYVEGIVSGSDKPTEFADANYDDKIDEMDIDQIRKLIAGTEESLTIKDALNRNVTLELPIERAVGVKSCAIEILRAIDVDLQNIFVGATSYATTNSEYFPELQEKFSHKWGSPDYEHLAKLNVDLVIGYKNLYKDESFEKYEIIGIPVICLDCFSKQSLDGDVAVLGEIFKQREKAQELLDWYHGYIDLVKERTDNLDSSERPKTVFYSNPDYYYPTIKVRNKNSGDHWVITDAGGDNLGENLNSTTGVAEVDPEWVMTQNPDVIVSNINQAFNRSGYSADETLAVEYMRAMHEKIISDEAINQTNAAVNGRIHLVCNDLNAGPMQAVGTVFMAKILHPELFEDLDAEEMLREYLEDWQGVPCRGVWIYPPLE